MISLDPDAIARVVLDCPEVAALSDQVATYLPGRRIDGVAVRGGAAPMIEVHVVGRWGPPIARIADQVREAVDAVAPGVPLNVVIADLDLGQAGG